jgi:hypothetical protein
MFRKLLLTLSLLQFVIISFNCERDLPSSYNYNRTGSIVLLNPKGGEIYSINDTINVEWVSYNLNELLRLEMINENKAVYSVNNIPDSGSYILEIPDSLVPSETYQLKIESMIHPEINDINKEYFEIAPRIDGHWFYSDLNEFSGIEIELEMQSYISNSFIGSGVFHFRYFFSGNPVDYIRVDTVGGILQYPDVGFVMRELNGKEFNFVGEMITNNQISGRLFGFIDSDYGNLSDSLILIRQGN